jgi:hypothetical protein
MITLDSIPHQNPNAVGHVVDEQAVVVIPEQGNVKVFNEVGTLIWGSINGMRSIRDIVSLVCEAFAVDAATAEQDTMAFITEILNQDIVFVE